MKSKFKLTPWFTKGEKPTRIGVYNVSCQRKDQSGKWYSYWNGSNFSYFSYDVEDAYRLRDRTDSDPANELFQKGSWRGLATQTGK